ncbi:hypothetical protein F9R50_24495 [Vibrio parahaemolyticus]|nr:hypothetical protein [Vibrio parahaemolyticus]
MALLVGMEGLCRYLNNEHNKAFKTDSQRVAFLFWLSFVFTVAWFKLGGSVAHYLTRRYVLGGKNGIFSVLWNRLGCNGTYVSCYLANWK